MWTKIKWGLRILALVIVGLFLHYTLPQRDIVRIVDTGNQHHAGHPVHRCGLPGRDQRDGLPE
jgi:Protein of unknown function (DUF1523)